MKWHVYLNGIDITGDDNELSLFLLNQRGNCVDTLANNERTLSGDISLAGSTSLGAGTQSLLLGLLGLGPVLVQELEHLSSCKRNILVNI